MDPREELKEKAVKDAARAVRRHMNFTQGSAQVELTAPADVKRNPIRAAIQNAMAATGYSRKRVRRILSKEIREMERIISMQASDDTV